MTALGQHPEEVLGEFAVAPGELADIPVQWVAGFGEGRIIGTGGGQAGRRRVQALLSTHLEADSPTGVWSDPPLRYPNSAQEGAA